MIVESKRQIIPRGVATRAAPSQSSGAERVIYPNIEIIAAVIGGRNEMKVLEISGQIRLWNIRQQTFGNGINLRNCVIRKRGVGRWIKNFRRLSRKCSGGIGGLREISLTLKQRGNRGELIERLFTTPPVVVNEVEGLVSALVYMRDV